MIIDTVIVGAGHAGLAVSRLLSDAGRDHVVLERGQVAERWRSERWDSLHLLTPNWMTRLPGWCYSGPDPDGYLSSPALVDHLERYAASFTAPVITGTAVVGVVSSTGPGPARFRVVTEAGTWHAGNVVVATGPYGQPRLPAAAAGVSGGLQMITASAYRNPAALAPGGVLVVGASASGVQIAQELVRAGREVTLAVGRHTRVPRGYRGMDIFWWLDKTGRLARTVDDVRDVAAARRETSLQLIGNSDPQQRGRDLDLEVLQALGVRLVGRLEKITGTAAAFRTDLEESVAAADRKMHRLLDAIDRYVEDARLDREVLPPKRPGQIRLPKPTSLLDLPVEHMATVLFATGYQPHFPWLRVPVLAPDGSIRQRRGVTEIPGLYVVGQSFQHRRDSGYIDGARHDARYVVDHLVGCRTASARVCAA
jgi:putative flavoprotein involved in K+ transport